MFAIVHLQRLIHDAQARHWSQYQVSRNSLQYFAIYLYQREKPT